MTPFSIEWTIDDQKLRDLRPDLPAQRIRRLYFEDAAEVWANVLQGWPLLDDGRPLRLGDGSEFRLQVQAVFEHFVDGDPADKARVDTDELLKHLVAGRAGARFPSRGKIRIDLNDIDALLVDRARFKDTIVHEIGHVLGLGTMFDRAGLVDNVEKTPVYTGKRGLGAYADLLDLPPLEAPRGVPLQPEPAGTTRAFHWAERALRLDIMSTQLDEPFAHGGNGSGKANGEINVVSTVSAGALLDLGYLVDLTRASSISAALARNTRLGVSKQTP